MGGGHGEELEATITQGNLKENLEPNLDQVIHEIQVKFVEHVILVVASEASQLVQLVVEPIHVENPLFFITQPILVYGHSIDNLKHISIFSNKLPRMPQPG
jgi:hypothetical protein